MVGVVIGVDLEPCQPVEGAILLVGDITESSTQERIRNELDGRIINNIVSDISPDITGNWDIDQAVAMTSSCRCFRFLPRFTMQRWVLSSQKYSKGLASRS